MSLALMILSRRTVTAFLILLPATLHSAPKPESGFRGFKWGSDFQQVKRLEKLTLASYDFNPKNPDETFRQEGFAEIANLNFLIEYFFHNRKLYMGEFRTYLIDANTGIEYSNCLSPYFSVKRYVNILNGKPEIEDKFLNKSLYKEFIGLPFKRKRYAPLFRVADKLHSRKDLKKFYYSEKYPVYSKWTNNDTIIYLISENRRGGTTLIYLVYMSKEFQNKMKSK